MDLHPGELHLARQPTIIETMLGSCVAAVFWSARVGAGGMCHGVLPRSPNVDVEDAFRYVDFAILHLARTFDALGARRADIQVKLFGGADVLPILSSRADRPTVGALNCPLPRWRFSNRKASACPRPTWEERAGAALSSTPAPEKFASTGWMPGAAKSETSHERIRESVS